MGPDRQFCASSSRLRRSSKLQRPARPRHPMTVAFKHGLTTFVPRARLIKLLGGELIRDEVMAVSELVKNAYDADATVVRLDFLNASSTDGEICIEDDGCGMSAET